MRIVFIILLSIALSACKRSPDVTTMTCTNLDVEALSEVQRRAAFEYCSDNANRERHDTTVGRVELAARDANMSLEHFSNTRVGLVVLLKELFSVVMGLTIVLGLFLVTSLFIRMTMWEEDRAVRKKWGPFSYWEISYTRRKNAFLDIGPVGWTLLTGVVGLIIALIIYGASLP